MSFNPENFLPADFLPENFLPETAVPDGVPDAFSFSDETNVPLSTVITSGPITVSGIDVPVDISITGGTYSINGAAFTAGPGVGAVVNGDSIRVRVTSSASNLTTVSAVLTIGGVSDTFSVRTLAAGGGAWNQGVTGDELGFCYTVRGLGVVGPAGISTQE
jgi:hypothetical protein